MIVTGGFYNKTTSLLDGIQRKYKDITKVMLKLFRVEMFVFYHQLASSKLAS